MTIMNFSLYSTFLLSMTGLALHRTHLLSALLCLEGMMLALFISLSTWCAFSQSSLYSVSPMVMLTFSACGAGAGLAILVATTRTHGTDRMQNLNLLQC
ncbi:NADH dehydrogenase subunit 4L (mitochondrion) [Rhinatrema bivittatum]|uniref:NADH-ubiquinone oxidoreductase chain 4L n=1 Tax=Rhinatrema bivittatum TaxID=194408 RepID=Q64JR3_RHIBI|nr:NADH dehydrogenase subunit 4L [Rhinatrema bivittatum]AAS13726.1 NADH dehydrogenase subunit 4L [Rhinatrema bivittatum]